MMFKRRRNEICSSCSSSEEKGRKKKKIHHYFLRSQKMKSIFGEDDAALLLKELKGIRAKGQSVDWETIAEKLKMKAQYICRQFYFAKIEEVSLFSCLINEEGVQYDCGRDILSIPNGFWKKEMKKKYKRFKNVVGVPNYADWYSFKNFITTDNYSSVSHKRSYGDDGQTSKRSKNNFSEDVNSKDEIVCKACQMLRRLYLAIKDIEKQLGGELANGNYLSQEDLFVLLDVFDSRVNDARYFLQVLVAGQDNWPQLKAPFYNVQPPDLMEWLHWKVAQAQAQAQAQANAN